MAHFATEYLWHFIGYLHLNDLLNLAPIHYEGAPRYTVEGYVPDHHAKNNDFDVDWSGSVRGFSAQIPLSSDQTTFGGQIPLALKDLSEFPRLPNIFLPSSSVSPLAPVKLPGISQPSAPFIESLTVKATYNVGGSQYMDVFAHQANFMFDQDLVFGSQALFDQAFDKIDPEILQQLRNLVDAAEALIPAAVRDALTHPGGIERDTTSTGEDYATNLQNAGDQGELIDVEGSGKFINGMRVEEGPETIAEQSDSINAAITHFQDRHNLGTDEESTDFVEIFNDILPDGTLQTASLGENAQLNAASLIDYEEALSSRIILGDYHETNAIVQINVLSDVDGFDLSGRHLVEHLATSNNQLKNEATFVNEPGQLFGNLTQGAPGSTNWQIDYVVGNFYDVTTVVQNNALIDNDLNDTDATHSQYIAELGENGQLNITQLLELGSGYDLIIIAGNYYKFNAIIQTNIILDDDLIEQYTNTDNNLDQSATAGNNLLLNDAAIYNIGGATFNPLNENAQELADTIGALTEEFDYSLAIGLPGDGDDVLEILYITGDYYNYNIVLQTNVISDADQSTQTATGDGVNDMALTQTADAGDNTAENTAVIVDLDSQSEYQFLGGEVYEETILVQANIIEDDENSYNDESDLHEDVIATVAAMSGQDGGQAEDNAFTPPDSTTDDADVMGNMLT